MGTTLILFSELKIGDKVIHPRLKKVVEVTRILIGDWKNNTLTEIEFKQKRFLKKPIYYEMTFSTLTGFYLLEKKK